MSVSTDGNERDNQAVEENGTGCDGSECLQIFKELRQLHEANLRRIDDEVGRDGSEIKLIAMQSWISDLEEQNALFLQTMVQLEQEAGDRVSLLQEGLHRSSRAALAYRTKLDDYDKDDFVEKPILSARNEELQHTQIQKLESDITNLLELIRRVREENRLDATGLTFNEVTFEDIFGTDNMISGHTDCTVHDSQISTSISISWETTQSTHQNQGKDAVIAYLNDEIRRLHLDMEKCKDDKGREVSKMEEEILTLKCDNKQKDEQIHRLSNEDIRESLTAEVASKHDEIVALRREKLNLEEKCHELEMKARLKDEIIMELRKDLKASGFKRVSCSADHRNVVNNSQQEEQSLRNVSQHVDNSSNNNQQVKAPVNKSDYQLKQVPASPDEPQHSFPYQYQSTPKKSSTFCSKKKLCDVGNTDEQQSACDRSLCLEHANWSDIPNATDQRSADGTPYEVCRRNSPSARDGQLSADGKVMFRPERGTVHLKNFDLQENNNMDTAEHLKNLLLISDNTVKKQQENISGLQDTVKKYENDLNDLQIKVEQMEVELKDSKLKYIQQITDQDAMINDLRKTARTSQTEVEMLKEKCEKYERSAEAVQEERENLKTEMEKLKNNLMSREKVAANQEEIINILQDSVNIAQKEQQDLQQKLKDAEGGKEKLLNTLQEERKKAENLQEALMVTKQQLEDLQGNKYEVSVNSGMSWGWSHTSRSGRVNKRTVHDV